MSKSANSVYYSRGYLYAKEKYKKAETNFQKSKIIMQLKDEVNKQEKKTQFEYGILGFIKEQKSLKKS